MSEMDAVSMLDQVHELAELDLLTPLNLAIAADFEARRIKDVELELAAQRQSLDSEEAARVAVEGPQRITGLQREIDLAKADFAAAEARIADAEARSLVLAEIQRKQQKAKQYHYTNPATIELQGQHRQNNDDWVSADDDRKAAKKRESTATRKLKAASDLVIAPSPEYLVAIQSLELKVEVCRLARAEIKSRQLREQARRLGVLEEEADESEVSEDDTATEVTP